MAEDRGPYCTGFRRADEAGLFVLNELENSAEVVCGDDRTGSGEGFDCAVAVVFVNGRVVDGAGVGVEA